MIEIPFKDIRRWPGGKQPDNWQTAKSWDVLNIIKQKAVTREIVEQLKPFSLADLQAAYKVVGKYPGSPNSAWVVRRRQMDLLKHAFYARQVPDIIAKYKRKVKKAMELIREDPPDKISWRSRRSWRMLLPLAINHKMKIETRMRDLLEVQPEDLHATLKRNDAYKTSGALRFRNPKPAYQVDSALRTEMIHAALQLMEELRT